MWAARSVPVNRVAKGILPAGLPDSSRWNDGPRASSKERNSPGLSFSRRPGQGLDAGSGEEPLQGQVAACREDSLGECLVLDRPRNPEPADAEGADCERTIFRDVTARLDLQPGGETPDDRFEACLDRSAGPRDLGYQGRQRTPVLGLDKVRRAQVALHESLGPRAACQMLDRLVSQCTGRRGRQRLGQKRLLGGEMGVRTLRPSAPPPPSPCQPPPRDTPGGGRLCPPPGESSPAFAPCDRPRIASANSD